MAALFDTRAQSPSHVGIRRRYVVPLSILAHGVLFAVIVIAPILAAARLPLPTMAVTYAGLAEPRPAPPAQARSSARPQTVAASASRVPIEPPSSIAPEVVRAPPSLGVAFGEPGVPGGVDVGPGTPLGSPPPPTTPKAPTAPVPVGGLVTEPTRVKYVEPVYPPIAVRARVAGVVIIEATLSTDGSVVNARVIRSEPLLDEAALAAVRQWKYTPTRLNGTPVEVIMTVTVVFQIK
jgi:protein TonB